jgi:lysophospholipase L1-like esterase
MRRMITLLVAMLVTGALQAAVVLPEGAHPERAVIEAPEALAAWSQALADLKAGKRKGVSVCHFGDSHLQSGQVDAVLRQGLQALYGDGGRGYVFPYAALGTSSPSDLGSESDADWRLRRMMGDSAGGVVGPGGLAAVSAQPNFVLGFDTRKVDPATTFDRVRVLFTPGADRSELWVATRPQATAYMNELERKRWHARAIKPGDTLSAIALEEGCSVDDLKRWNGSHFKLRAGRDLQLLVLPPPDAPRMQGFTVWGVLKGDDPLAMQGVPVDLGSREQHVFILGAQSKPAQSSAEILGLMLEHQDGQGLIWNSLAANGAQAQHFSALVHLPQQLQMMAPDLVVVSLGTNETQQLHYDQERAIEQQQLFWAILKKAAPQAALLVVSPSDAVWGNRHKPSKRLDPYIAALREAALASGAAFIDLRTVQGGQGAYARWAKAGLAGKDGVHYKSAGYKLWGQWLLDALQAVGEPHVP